MQNRFDLRNLRLTALVVAFALGVLLSSAVSKAQYMLSTDISCQAQCIPPSTGHGSAVCPDTCTNVPAGQSCTCDCNSDNVGSGGECSVQCDYGNLGDSYCP